MTHGSHFYWVVSPKNNLIPDTDFRGDGGIINFIWDHGDAKTK